VHIALHALLNSLSAADAPGPGADAISPAHAQVISDKLDALLGAAGAADASIARNEHGQVRTRVSRARPG
jgi:hypothetical protein